MGEATMQRNGVAMVHRHGQGAWIGPAFEQRQRGVLHLQSSLCRRGISQNYRLGW